MNQFKDVFLGMQKRDHFRLTTSERTANQRSNCLRIIRFPIESPSPSCCPVKTPPWLYSSNGPGFQTRFRPH
jgi:hypothetical protein